MKPTPYDLLRAFLYAENHSNSPSWVPDETYLKIRDFIQSQEKIVDSGLVWQSGRFVYEALNELPFGLVSRDRWPTLSTKELKSEVQLREVMLTCRVEERYSRVLGKEISDLMNLLTHQEKKASEQRI